MARHCNDPILMKKFLNFRRDFQAVYPEATESYEWDDRFFAFVLDVYGVNLNDYFTESGKPV